MISVDIKEVAGVEYKVTTSDKYCIQKVGTDEVYVEAWDEIVSAFEYVETDILLPKDIEEVSSLNASSVSEGV